MSEHARWRERGPEPVKGRRTEHSSLTPTLSEQEGGERSVWYPDVSHPTSFRPPLRLLIATSNPHKLDEMRAVFGDQAAGDGSPLELLSLADLSRPIPEPVEDGSTFKANAVLKAMSYAAASGLPTLADDSGLEVDALGGEPGVRSARYAGATGDRPRIDAANNRKLMAAMRDVPIDRRGARFVCAMAYVNPDADDARPLIVRGEFEGRIIMPDEAADPAHADRGRGTHGFGYDPLLLLPGRGVTSGELTPDEKNAVSHRGAATRLMLQRLREHGVLESEI